MSNTSSKGRTLGIRSLLERIGLNNREIEIYMTLLPRKVARASVISKASKQSRSHTYLVLRSLEEKGLVSEIERGKILHFVAESPQRLLSYIENREEELHVLKPLVADVLPQLHALTSPLAGKPRVTMLHGIEGMKQVYREMLPKDFCGIFNPQAMYDAFGKNIAQMVLGKDTRIRGRDLLVDNAMSKRWLSEVTQHEGYSIRLLPKGVTFYSDTNFSDDTVALFSYDDEQTIICIENKNLVDSFKAWFEMMWNISRPT